MIEISWFNEDGKEGVESRWSLQTDYDNKNTMLMNEYKKYGMAEAT